MSATGVFLPASAIVPSPLWVQWVWNSTALRCAAALLLLDQQAMAANRACRLDEYFCWCAAQVATRKELQHARQCVAEECAPWFDGSAFSALES